MRGPQDRLHRKLLCIALVASCACFDLAKATPGEAVFRALEEYETPARVSATGSSVGMAYLTNMQAPAILQSPGPDAPARVDFTVTLPAVGENMRLTLALAYGLSTPADDTTAPRGRQTTQHVVHIDNAERVLENFEVAGWPNFAHDLTPHAGKTIRLGLETRTPSPIAPRKTCWIAPAIFAHDPTGPMRVIPFFHVLQTDSAEITFGPKGTAHNMQKVENEGEGISSFEYIEGTAYATPGRHAGAERMLYYRKVDETFGPRGDWGNYVVFVDYLDMEGQRILFDYDSFDPRIRARPELPGAFKRFPTSIQLTGSMEKKTHAFPVQDAWFGGGCNYADFRFVHNGPFYLSRVSLSKIYPPVQVRESVRRIERFKDLSSP